MSAGAASFELPNPQLSTDRAREIVRAHWGLDGEAEEIGSTQDQNFKITAADGRRFVLKIANPQWRRSELEMQNAAMHHVAAQRTDFAVPVPVAAPGGEEILRVGDHDVRLVTWVDGRPLADFGHLDAGTWRALGRLAARSARAMDGFEHPELDRELQWDPRWAAAVVDALGPLAGDADRAILDRAVAPLGTVGDLPLHPIHNDVTDYNTVAPGGGIAAVVPDGLLDFGDAVRTWRVCDPACAAVSAIVHDCADPLGIALAVLAGYHAESPLPEAEVEAFWPVVLARAAVCAISATQQSRLSPENTLAALALVHDWAVLRAVDTVPPALAVAAARAVCGFEPSPAGSALPATVAAAGPLPVVDGALAPVDLSVGSELLAFGEWQDPTELAGVAVADGAIAVGRWGETRPDADGPAQAPAPGLRLGADLFAPAGTPVRAPLDGAVVRAAGDELEIACATGYVRFAGLAPRVAAGDRVARGETVGTVAAPALHVGLGVVPGLPAAGDARERAAWLALSPDPSALLGIDAAAATREDATVQRARRERAVAAAQRLYFDDPPEFVRGWRHELYDADGRAYVDAINNVAVVGHSHPGVAAAAARQFRLLNTNSRFLYDAMTRYAERLSALLPDELDTVFLVNSGSEAVDLALRLARTFTGRHDVAALQGAYHGWTTATDELCTSPMDNPNWRERLPAHVHVLDQPDPFRGRFGDDGPAYVASLDAAIRAASPRGGLAAFICEPLLGNQGGVEPARGYLAAAYAAARSAGAVCIADEVQVGYARTGEDFWAFEHEGVVPDIVCVAKATGNGHPVGAVICRRQIADAFDRAAPFFSSTGGGPVSCEIGLAVLDAIEQEELQANALQVGARLRAGFERLAAEHPLIGAVHGRGLYLGVDLVRDPVTREPAPEEAEWICERVRQLGAIVRPTGDAYNVLKIKPPLCIDEAAADHLLAALGRALEDLESRRG